MNFWRRLFPKYDCRKCKDTFVIYGQYFIARCDCPRSVEAIQKAAADFWRRLEGGSDG